MAKVFNTYGYCDPQLHYMVDLTSRLEQIRAMVDDEKYFTINRGRQYGKTTVLTALAEYLQEEYTVVSMDFQTMSWLTFENESFFVSAFSEELLDLVLHFPEDIEEKLREFAEKRAEIISLRSLFKVLRKWCMESEKRIVLLIDEVDSATNNQVFLDFLAQLRYCYLRRRKIPTFQSVILAGVYDVRNIRRRIRPDEEHKVNSPWNIAAKFGVDMDFSEEEIAEMLKEYETDHSTGMDIEKMSGMIYDYTSGYPYLVSGFCKSIDEEIAGTKEYPDKSSAWTKEGFLEALKLILSEKSPLFESLISKLDDYPELKSVVYHLLFQGQSMAYNADNMVTDMLLMFGFIKVEQGTMRIANRVFETRLYNYFLTLPEVQNGEMYKAALRSKEQFIQNGRLDMRRILERFVVHFDEIYGDRDKKFVEEDGRRYFMLYLKPIINGIGNCYVEAQTRNQERTDLIIDYLGEQFVVELKIWRGNAYHERGEGKLKDYLDYYHVKKGYMLSFNFNKKKEIGVKEITLGDKVLIEAVV